MDQSPNTEASKNLRLVHLRKKILEVVYRARASHIGSSFSVAEILFAVFSSIDIDKVWCRSSDRDRVLLSKGHAAAALYVVLSEFGLMTEGDLGTYCTNGSLLGGHATHHVRYVEHSTGALGHGLPVAVGVCIGMKTKKIGSRVFVIVGDSELHEGSNWEAMMLAGHLNLDNLRLLVDYNTLGGIDCIDNCCSLEPLHRKLESFGFSVFEIDGHDLDAIMTTFKDSQNSATPVAIICHTVKGKGVSFMEGNNAWHYRPPSKDEYERALSEITGASES